jgi:uncharacterized protein YfcZ (UPF0381/DUF406 family)
MVSDKVFQIIKIRSLTEMADDILKDCGNECGCAMEIGTVINDNDCVFECELHGESDVVDKTYNHYVEEAKSICESAVITTEDQENAGVLTKKVRIEFSCTAENIIFQMRVKPA